MPTSESSILPLTNQCSAPNPLIATSSSITSRSPEPPLRAYSTTGGDVELGETRNEAEGKRPKQPERQASVIEKSAEFVKESIWANVKNDTIAMAGEFVGTVLFLITSLGAAQSVATVTNDLSGNAQSTANANEKLSANFYKAFAAGAALYGTASIFYRFTGSIFNPSVSLALLICGVIKPVRFLFVCFSQMIGGIVACFILSGLLPGPSTINLQLSDSTSLAQGLFIETFATATLILSVLMLSVEKHVVTPHAPLGFGFTLMAAMLFSMQYTGSGINVARAFGASCVEGFQTYHWIYWVGPSLGACLASGFYEFLKFIKYWQVNPDQDATQPIVLPPQLARTKLTLRPIRTAHH